MCWEESMASSFTKKRFREPESVEHTIENVKKSTPRSTMYKNRWAVRIFEEWQVVREMFDMSDAELDTLLSQFDWSEFDNHAQRNIAPEQMMLSSNTFNNCSVNTK